MPDLRTLLLNQDTQGGELFESPKERLLFYRPKSTSSPACWPNAPAPTWPRSRS